MEGFRKHITVFLLLSLLKLVKKKDDKKLFQVFAENLSCIKLADNEQYDDKIISEVGARNFTQVSFPES